MVVSILASFLLIYRFSRVFLIFFTAVVLSTAIRPVVRWLNQRGLPRPAGVILLYLLGFSLLAVLVVAVTPLLVEQVTEISTEFPVYYANLRSDLIQSRSRILQEIAIQMPPVIMLPYSIPAAGGLESGIQVAEQVTRSLPYSIFARSVLALTAVFVLGFPTLE
jgi:predicted PurR-regulated permease PerM